MSLEFVPLHLPHPQLAERVSNLLRLDNTSVEREAREVLARLSKRKRRGPPAGRTEKEDEERDEELEEVVCGILAECQVVETGNIANLPLGQLRLVARDAEKGTMLSGLSAKTALENVEFLGTLLGLQQIDGHLQPTEFCSLAVRALRSDLTGLKSQMSAFLKDVTNERMLALVCRNLIDTATTADLVTELEKIDVRVTSTIFSNLLLHKGSETVETVYQTVGDIFADPGFQAQVLQLSSFISEDQSTIDRLLLSTKQTVCVCEVNPRNTLLLFAALPAGGAVFSFVSDILKQAISNQSTFNFTLSLILCRLLHVRGSKPYAESYQTFFGPSSSHLTSTRSVDFVLDQFIRLVPHEAGVFLKHHIQLPLRGGAKVKVKLEQYLMLAKTRMKDFNLQDIDRNVIHDVERALASFKRNPVQVPTGIVEASIFKKQYYTNHFLPCLIHDPGVSDDGLRQRLVSVLKAAKKIPASVVMEKEEVMEISPDECLENLIFSLPTTYDFKGTGKRLLAQFSSHHSKQQLSRLISVVCLECSQVNSVQFLRPFYAMPRVKDLFVECLIELVSTKEDSSKKLLLLLEFFDTTTAGTFLRKILQHNYKLYSSIPVAVESDFLHLILLGKLTDNCEALIPEIVWRKVSVESLCSALTWWPIGDLKDIVTTKIFDRVISFQPCNDVYVTVFKASIQYSSEPFLLSVLKMNLPLVTSSKLWVYEALAHVLLPYYQSNVEKPTALIRQIFNRFFSVVHRVEPSLLWRCDGDHRMNIDNLVSVLDSYKIYLTVDNFLLALPILFTIVRSVSEERWFNKLCERSPTLLVSCVYHYETIKSHSWVQRCETLTTICKVMKRLKSDGSSSHDRPPDKLNTLIGVSWFLVYQDKHINDICANPGHQSGVTEGYLTAMFHCYARFWLGVTLTEHHLASLGSMGIVSDVHHESYVKGIVLQNHSTPDGSLVQHFSGYKTDKVFCLVYLGALAHSAPRLSSLRHRESALSAAKKCYQLAQRLVFDNPILMRTMQQFVHGIARSSADIPQLARAFLSALTTPPHRLTA